MTTIPAMSRWRLAGLVFVFLWFAIGGVAHFVATEAEMQIVPPWIPWPRETVWVSGVFFCWARPVCCGGRRAGLRESGCSC